MKFGPLLAVFILAFSAPSCEQKNKALEKKDDPRLASLKVPEGFRISFFATDVENARSLALGDNGTVFVGNREGKNVFALVDTDKDGVADKKYTVAKNLNTPNGVAFHNGSLYIAELSRISRIDNIEATLEKPAKPVLVNDSFPTEKHHGWKYIAFGPDGKLYVPVGAPCNICDDNEKDKRFSSITRMARAWKFTRTVYATPWVSPGIRKRRNCGSRKMAATCSATICLLMNLMWPRRRTNISDTLIAMQANFPIRN